MLPGYAAAYAEAGTGSHDRRKMKLEGHVERIRGDMFTTAIQPVLEVRDGACVWSVLCVVVRVCTVVGC